MACEKCGKKKHECRCRKDKCIKIRFVKAQDNCCQPNNNCNPCTQFPYPYPGISLPFPYPYPGYPCNPCGSQCGGFGGNCGGNNCCPCCNNCKKCDKCRRHKGKHDRCGGKCCRDNCSRRGNCGNNNCYPFPFPFIPGLTLPFFPGFGCDTCPSFNQCGGFGGGFNNGCCPSNECGRCRRCCPNPSIRPCDPCGNLFNNGCNDCPFPFIPGVTFPFPFPYPGYPNFCCPTNPCNRSGCNSCCQRPCVKESYFYCKDDSCSRSGSKSGSGSRSKSKCKKPCKKNKKRGSQ